MRQIFISDLHLDASLPYLAEGFFRFIADYCDDADELYILGDFFEVWLGDDHDTEFNSAIIDALKELPGNVYLMHGNRDFLLGEGFARSADATLLPDPTIIDTSAGRALLLHGDSLCTEDEAYMQARRTLRSEAFQEDFLSKTIDERDAYARQIRGASKAHTRETAEDIMDVTPNAVVGALDNSGVNIMIHGHTHRPSVHDLTTANGSAKRYVLGDWGDSMQYLVIENSQPELLTYQVRT